MKQYFLCFLMVLPSLGQQNFCPLEDIIIRCNSKPDGPKFMLAANCDPFNPYDPQCFIRLENDPFRTCYYCCDRGEDNDSFQKCSDLRANSTHVPTYPNGWLQAEITDALCYEKGYINVGEALKIFELDGKYVNGLSPIESISECAANCRKYQHRGCQWWNYDPVNKGCWLKKGEGNEKRSTGKYKEMYTGHRDSSKQCPERLHSFVPAVLSQRSRNSGSPGGSNQESNQMNGNGHINDENNAIQNLDHMDINEHFDDDDENSLPNFNQMNGNNQPVNNDNSNRNSNDNENAYRRPEPLTDQEVSETESDGSLRENYLDQNLEQDLDQNSEQNQVTQERYENNYRNSNRRMEWN